MIRIDDIPPNLRALVDRALREEPGALLDLELTGWLLALETDGHGDTRDAVIPLTELEVDFAWREFADGLTAHRRLELIALREATAGLRREALAGET